MPSRRTLLKAALAALAVPAGLSRAWGDPAKKPSFRAPKEGDPHEATWMAYGATASAWGTRGAFGASRAVARHDLMRIALTLSRFEPVRMVVANDADLREAKAVLKRVAVASDPKDQVNPSHDPAAIGTSGRILASRELPQIQPKRIEFIVHPINDLWTRDTAPVFVRDSKGRAAGLDLNFNGWGQERIRTGLKGWRFDHEKQRAGVAIQDVSADQRLARFIIKHTRIPRVSTWLTMEGGAIEVNGRGLAVVAASCILNPNRNPGKTRAEVEAEFRRVFGVEHVMWIPGVRATEITDGHVDFYARFATDTEIVYNWDGGLTEDGEPSVDAGNRKALRAAAKTVNDLPLSTRSRLLGKGGARVTLTPLHAPDPDRVEAAVLKRTPALKPDGYFQTDTFAAGFVGYYEANGCILMSQFGDPEADAAAFRLLASRYPSRTVVQLTTDGLANGGGTIHCATQQQIEQRR